MKRLVRITLTIGATLLALGLLWVFQPTLVLFGGSLAISAALRPLVQQLESRGLSRSRAILIWYLLLIVGLGIGVVLYGVGIADEVSSGADALPRTYSNLLASWQQGTSIQRTIASNLPQFDVLMQSLVSGEGASAVGGTLLGLSSNLASWLLFAFAVLSLAYYWLIEAAHFERLWLSFLPINTRVQARTLWRNAEVAVGAYIRSTTLAIAIAALLLLTLYRLVQLPFATLLALLGGFSQLVPRLGPVASVILAFGMAFVTLPLWQALLILVGGIVIQYATHVFAERAMQADAFKVNAFLQVVVLLALAELGGIWSLIYAPPLAALIQVLFAGFTSTSTVVQAQESMIDILRNRLDRLKEMPEAERLDVLSTIRRSDALLNDVSAALENN